MKKSTCQVIFLLVLIGLFFMQAPAFAKDCKAKSKDNKVLLNDKNAPEYDLLFFRNDGRIIIIMPPKTTFVMVYRSEPNKKGFVKCISAKGETLAVDRDFQGDVELITPVYEPSLRKHKIVVTRYDGKAIGFYTPEDASYIEVINARNGFDGVVTVMNKKKKILNRQTGLGIEIINYGTPEIMKDQPLDLEF